MANLEKIARIFEIDRQMKELKEERDTLVSEVRDEHRIIVGGYDHDQEATRGMINTLNELALKDSSRGSLFLINIRTIGHVDHGKAVLTAAINRSLALASLGKMLLVGIKKHPKRQVELFRNLNKEHETKYQQMIKRSQSRASQTRKICRYY